MQDRKTGRIGAKNYPEVLKLIQQDKTASEIANIFSVNPETIRKFARKRDLHIKKQDMTMDNHPSWKGGETLDRSGYILRMVSRESVYGYLIRAIAIRGVDNLPDKNGYAPVHRIVMHDKLGRDLVRGEVVDHIDGNNQNNNPDNLRVFPSNAEHLRETLKGKVPNWTVEGKSRITGRPKGNQNKDF